MQKDRFLFSVYEGKRNSIDPMKLNETFSSFFKKEAFLRGTSI